jgi:hypothetical protein
MTTSFTHHVSCTYLPLWYAGRAGAKGHGVLNLTGRGIQPSRSTSQTPADGTLPLKHKQNVRIHKHFLSHSIHYVTNKNTIMSYIAVQSGKLLPTFPRCMPSSYSEHNETACSSTTKLHGVTTSVSTFTAVKNSNLNKIPETVPYSEIKCREK